MNKYIVLWIETAEAVCVSRADAEELILAFVEEYLYNECNSHNSFAEEDFFEEAKRGREEINKLRINYPNPNFPPFQTLNGYLLCSRGRDYAIEEVPEV